MYVPIQYTAGVWLSTDVGALTSPLPVYNTPPHLTDICPWGVTNYRYSPGYVHVPVSDIFMWGRVGRCPYKLTSSCHCTHCQGSLYSPPGVAVLAARGRCTRRQGSLYSPPGVAVLAARGRCTRRQGSLYSPPEVTVLTARGHCTHRQGSLYRW